MGIGRDCSDRVLISGSVCILPCLQEMILKSLRLIHALTGTCVLVSIMLVAYKILSEYWTMYFEWEKSIQIGKPFSFLNYMDFKFSFETHIYTYHSIQR